MPEPVFDRAGSDASAAMRALMQELFPICRSITGNGVRQTLEVVGRRIPISITERGKRGLYSAIGRDGKTAERQLRMLWLLNMSDGQHSLLDIAERAKITFREAAEMARVLEEHGLLQASTTGAQ
jgi:aminopeptidase-like protein